MEADGGEAAKLIQAHGRTCTALRADFSDRVAVAGLAASSPWPAKSAVP
jgi:hypothetical protein